MQISIPGLQAGLVESYHIDDIGDFSRPLEVQGKMSDYRGKKISELIKEFLEDPLAAPIDFKKLLKDSIHLTVSILADPSNRKAERIDLLSEILDSNNGKAQNRASLQMVESTIFF